MLVCGVQLRVHMQRKAFVLDKGYMGLYREIQSGLLG